jgi:hypothetical protein
MLDLSERFVKIRTHAHKQTNKQTHTHTHTHARAHTRAHAHTHTHTQTLKRFFTFTKISQFLFHIFTVIF